MADMPPFDSVTDEWVVLWFDPNADKKRVFTDEKKAREFAAREEIKQWNPLLEHRIVCVITELVPL